jgi:hypothetical protein
MLVGGGATSAVAAAGIHAARAAWTDRLDHMLGGSPGVGAVTGAWAHAKGTTAEDLWVATVVANEVGARIGAALMLGTHNGAGAAWVYAAAAATASGRLMGLSEDKLAHAIALSLASSGPIPRAVLAGEGRCMAVANAVMSGLEASKAAGRGVRGCLDILEAPGGLLEASSSLPLHHAFSGLGQGWLTETLSIPRWPGPPAWHSVLDGVSEVLKRHIKAADKRLRPDQVQRIKVAVPAPAIVQDRWMARYGLRSSLGLGHAIRHAVGALVVDHEFDETTLASTGWPERRDCYGAVASRVVVEHSLDLSLDAMANMVNTAAPLIGGINESEWRALHSRLDSGLVHWDFGGVRSLVKHRPDKWLGQLKHASRNLGDARLGEWQYRMGAKVSVYTIRGGNWPENIATPVGSPGTSWNALVDTVLEGFGKGNPDRLAAASWVWESSSTLSGVQLIEGLLS